MPGSEPFLMPVLSDDGDLQTDAHQLHRRSQHVTWGRQRPFDDTDDAAQEFGGLAGTLTRAEASGGTANQAPHMPMTERHCTDQLMKGPRNQNPLPGPKQWITISVPTLVHQTMA
jgi:hypothetical protein